MFGLGGGFIIVPLLNVAGVDMKTAVGTSAAAIFFNAVSATAAYARYGYVDYRAGFLLSATAVVSAYFGALLTEHLDVDVLRVAFGVMLLLVSVRTAMTGARTGDDRASGRIRWSRRAYSTLLVGGALAGLASGLLGVGGGVVNVPLLAHLGAVMQVAVATSSMAITLTSITSALTHYNLGNVDAVLLAFLAPALVVGAQVGARVARRASSRSLKVGFSAVLAFVAVRMILKGLGYQVP